jgi:hypothetical protein
MRHQDVVINAEQNVIVTCSTFSQQHSLFERHLEVTLYSRVRVGFECT